ncbi:hypothetical protein [Rhodococcoides fascians]|uniref:hypothetical protein n=1 Tax=Rhodococcoides fascians TaxID=1828 RepID=UPI00055AAFF8|nr:MULTISPECIES: hypothetical protein [Rhodococcus]OZF05549.1 hypothetical protein CH301_03950 [Rhodococcus sp. 15-1189-1-1a]OZF20333.1 hypothetical protein CH299_04495 [Rhodococcus sp. 14-2686-1-2]
MTTRGNMAITHEQVISALETLGITRGAEQNVVTSVLLTPHEVQVSRVVRGDNKNLVEATETVRVKG